MFEFKQNQRLVRVAHGVVYVLFLDALLGSIPEIVGGLQNAGIAFRNIPGWVEFLDTKEIELLSRLLILIAGVFFFYFLKQSFQIIIKSFQDLEQAKSETDEANRTLVKANENLDAISKKIEALVDFGKELNTKIYAGEDAIHSFIHEKADNFMHTENMYIAMYEPDNDEVNFPLFFKEGVKAHIPSRKAGHGRTEAIIDSGNSILIHNKQESREWYQQPGRKEYIGDELSSWIGVPMKDHEGRVLGVVATYHPEMNDLYDTDDLRVLESMADLAVIAIENARLVERLKTVQIEIAERERELVTSGFAMDFTHKINNLVGPMQPWVQLLRRRLSEESRENEKVNKIIQRINQDIGLILQEAKQLRQPMTDPEPIDLEGMIIGILGQVELLADENVSIHFEERVELPEINGVRQQLSAVIYSIIQNGLKALRGKDEGNLTVSLDRGELEQEEAALVIIRDDGVGIEPHKQDVIFEFGVTQWKNATGTGYGLWRARNVIQNYGGKLELTYSELNKGTEFTIYLPFTQESTAE
jgi:signal transduction histidine kinase